KTIRVPLAERDFSSFEKICSRYSISRYSISLWAIGVAFQTLCQSATDSRQRVIKCLLRKVGKRRQFLDGPLLCIGPFHECQLLWGKLLQTALQSDPPSIRVFKRLLTIDRQLIEKLTGVSQLCALRDS